MSSLRWIFAVFVCFCLIHGREAFLPLISERSSSSDSSDCDTECDEDTPSEPVCGNDGRTYESECEIERAKCQGHPVIVKHPGKCSDKGRCESQRTLMLDQRHSKQGMFIPECKDDGSYAEVQCHHSTGYCWCVDEDGKPVRGSSTQNSRPNCSRTGKRTNKRRSNRGRRNKKACSSTDRASFNANLIDIFESEFNRLSQPPTTSAPSTDPLTDTHEKAVIQWKFDQLDSNNDRYLKKREVRDLRRMAKKIVKPKACAKTFAKYCDLDQDKKISKSEWSVCVGVDINISFRLFMSLNSDEQVNALDRVLDDDPSVEDLDDLDDMNGQPDLLNKQTRPRLRHDRRIGHPVENDATDGATKEEETQDCETARQIAMDNHRQDPAAGIYVPDCTANGLYVRAQCHKSTKYCWCVHPRSGKPIKGTATQGIKPDCDSARKGAKSFKGCSLHKKQEFLDELVESFIKEMSEDAKNRSFSLEIPTPEKAARWKFSSIDTNSNVMLDKREWKAFKKEWRSFHTEGKTKRRLRKCWRNLPRFCDENNNQKITMDEWLVCTGITRDYKGVLPRNHRRRGPNPFSTILKSD